MKRLLVLIIMGLCSLSSCHLNKTPASREIRVGTMAGPDAHLLEIAKNVAKTRYNLDVKIIIFRHYRLPNQALEDGAIDINMFQHLPYLRNWEAEHHVNNLVPIAKTFIYPMGIYSDSIDYISELPRHAWVAIPNDPANEARALLLLQATGLIKLQAQANIQATLGDIISNPKQLRFREVSAAELSAWLPKVAMALISDDYAIAAGLHPEVNHDLTSRKDAIFLESATSFYTNVFVVRADKQDDLRVKQFITAFQSPQVSAVARIIYHGSAIKAW